MKNQVIHGNCVDVLGVMDSETVDMALASPPYDNLRDYKGFSFDVVPIIKELYRVIKKGGVVVWVVADATIRGSETGSSFRQALAFMEAGFNLHDTMIYAKKNPLVKTHNRYEQEWEYMFVFSKGKPKTFNPIMEDCKLAGRIRSQTATLRRDSDELTQFRGAGKPIKNTKIRGNIFYYTVGKGRSVITSHPATFPIELAKDQISTWSNEGDLILDPMAGGGTTLVVAKEMGRNYIGVDISAEYCKDIEKLLESTAPAPRPLPPVDQDF